MSSRASRKVVNHERWLVSYADFITLLFAFFVVLYAFAKDDQRKAAQVSAAIDSAFRSMSVLPSALQWPSASPAAASGADQRLMSTKTVTPEVIRSPAKVRNDLEQMRRELVRSLAPEIQKQAVTVQMGRDGLVISLREAGFFDSGSANPRPGTMKTLSIIASTIGQTPYDVRVEGHTDNTPIHNAEFDSNWELASARATRITRLFLESYTIAPERLSAAGYGEFHPIADNSTLEGRAKNRRVDLVVTPRMILDFSQPGDLSPSGAWKKITDGD